MVYTSIIKKMGIRYTLLFLFVALLVTIALTQTIPQREPQKNYMRENQETHSRSFTLNLKNLLGSAAQPQPTPLNVNPTKNPQHPKSNLIVTEAYDVPQIPSSPIPLNQPPIPINEGINLEIADPNYQMTEVSNLATQTPNAFIIIPSEALETLSQNRYVDTNPASNLALSQIHNSYVPQAPEPPVVFVEEQKSPLSNIMNLMLLKMLKDRTSNNHCCCSDLICDCFNDEFPFHEYF